MRFMRRAMRRIRGTFSPAHDRDVREELQAHLDLLTDEYRGQGLSERDARSRAHRELGNTTSLALRTRAVASYGWLDAVWQDVRHVLKGLRRSPGFTLSALVTLTLAIGATTAVFSMVYGVLLRPLPFVQPDTLVRLWEEHPGGRTMAGGRWLSQWTYHAWTGHARSLTMLGGYTTRTPVIRFDDQAFATRGASLTPSLVQMIGARAQLGRWFTDADARPGAPPVLVLSHRLWQERFGGDSAVLGRTLIIGDESAVVIGVAMPDMTFPSDRADCWQPYSPPDPTAARSTSGFNAIARLTPGATPEQVAAEGTAAARAVDRPPSTRVVFGHGGPVVVHARPLAEDMAITVRPALLALGASVTLVLLVACANVANLLLARGIARQRELAIRMAIGSSRARLVGFTLIESLLLATTAGVLGVGMAAGLVRALPTLVPAQFPRLADVRLDAYVLFAALAVTLLTALLSGALPAVRSARAGAFLSLRSGDGGVSDGFRTRRVRRLRDALLVVESALAVVLLVGALLVGHSLARLMNVDPGYTAESVVTATFSVPRSTPAERGPAFVDAMLPRLRARPDVSAAGAATSMPMVPMTAITSFPVAPVPGAEPVMTRAITYVVTPGYAETIGLRLRDGRFFTATDQWPGVRAVIVNDAFARRYLDGPVVGRRFDRLYPDEGDVPTEIVGVVGHVLKDGHDTIVEPEIYFVHGGPTRTLDRYFSVAVRAMGDPSSMVATVREIASAVDSGVVLERVDRLSDRVSESMAQPRFATTVLALLAGLGVTLAAVGLFAVLSYMVTQRSREIGVRAALGASRVSLLTLVLRRGLGISAVGTALGLVAAAGLSRLLEGLLFGITPLDAFSFVLAPAILLPAAVAASLLPALRAASTAPAVVLRGE